jgi:hypothetical protein
MLPSMGGGATEKALAPRALTGANDARARIGSVRGRSPAPRVTRRQRARFARDGFLAVERVVVAPDDLAEARELVAGLFTRFDELPREFAQDLGDVQHHDGPQQIPEILHPSELEPQLATTAAFARCHELARRILGKRAECVFDHAILKPPHNGASTGWHQDLAYNPGLAGRAEVHIRLALQDIDEEGGCMRYIPEAGRHDLLPHHPRGGSARAHARVIAGVDEAAAVTCPVAAGMVTVHRLTTVHSAGANTTDVPRLAWILHFWERPTPRRVSRARVAAWRVKRSVLGNGAPRAD